MEFNENPFLKETPVVPFSNGTESMMWTSRNCGECLLYENESEKEEDAKCKLAFNLDLGTIIGTIPLWVAKEIGCQYNALYQSCSLFSNCRKKRIGDEPF